MTHPKVADVAVHAVASDIGEDEVKACIVLKPGEVVDFDEVIAHCVENMPYFAVPRYIEFLEELPRNPVGRVLKYTLRDRGITADTFDRGPGRPVVHVPRG